MSVQQAKVTASCWGSTSSVVPMFLFLSPCLFTAHPAINRSHSAEAFLSVLWHCGNNRLLTEGERMACQGQSCALISVHHWTAGLTLVPFTPEASWHYVWVCVCVCVCVCVLCFLSCLPLPFLLQCRGQPSETTCTIHTSSIRPQTWLRWGSHMWQADRGKREGDGEGCVEVAASISIPLGFVCLL